MKISSDTLRGVFGILFEPSPGAFTLFDLRVRPYRRFSLPYDLSCRVKKGDCVRTYIGYDGVDTLRAA
ncbi:MAG: hypothetical protein LC114_15865 [Bryobacterales bacterium]|nr:hypothetical protein [Bryobacterales bacterium]